MPGVRRLPDIGVDGLKGAVVVRAEVGAGTGAVVIAHHAHTGLGDDLVIGIEVLRGEGAEAQVGVGVRGEVFMFGSELGG